jgi:protein-S-isoprenylcysteine O-methyltransferase Ste14
MVEEGKKRRRFGFSQWVVMTLAVASPLGALLYHWVRYKHIGGSSAMFLGIPAIFAILLAMRPGAKTVTGGILKGITLGLLIIAPLLGEGYLCILMASPLFYLVGVVVGAIADWIRSNRNKTLSCVALGLLPLTLEGVVPSLTFPRHQSVKATRVIEATPEQVESALTRSPRVDVALPRLLRIGFPRPLTATGEGLQLGAMRTIHFSGAEGDPPGDLLMQVAQRRDGFVRFETRSDSSKLTQWIWWDASEVEWHAVDARHTLVTWRVAFERELDPVWYFGPWERAAVREAADYLIRANAIPVKAIKMQRAMAVRIGALYGPIMVAMLAGFLRVPRPKRFAGCLLSFLWTLPTLLLLQLCNERAQWWRYKSVGVSLHGIPLELYLGWAVLWGLVPQLASPRMRLWLCAVMMLAVDLVAMPLSSTVLKLGPHWLWGEAVALCLVLAPALCLARWTEEQTHLGWRAAMQFTLSGLLFLYLMPEIVFGMLGKLGWRPLFFMRHWSLQLALQCMALLALPGVSAVMEFAERGEGTPIPYDPPKRLVMSGIYRYPANPMQVSCTLVMFAWGALLQSGWLLLAAVVALVYSVGLATWDEGNDLVKRFGENWHEYRAQVKNWIPRWRPYVAGEPAKLYVARTCAPCSEVRRWFEQRMPVGLEIVDAETLPAGSIERIRYVDGEYRADGVRAVARALEHVNLGWALVGMLGRLPGVWWVVQKILDASGLGPRTLCEVPEMKS